MTRYSLHVGINDYPHAPLYGCVNDALDWEDLTQNLPGNKYVTRLLDAEATKATILGQLREFVRTARWGDRILFTYSGHGSWVPDLDGDEMDARDEVLCPVDYLTNVISDDELYDLFKGRRAGVRVTVISDSCHSGTLARKLDMSGLFLVDRRVRFLHPSTFLTGPARIASYDVDDGEGNVNRSSSRPGTVLLSGCAEDEVSWDATIGGRPRGAFTAAALDTYQPGSTISAWHKRIQGRLPFDGFEQHPQLTAYGWQRWWRL
jgi:hypothetical protein